MSSYVFPIMPLVQPAKAAPGAYATAELASVSGKSITAAWRVSAIRRVVFTLTLRAWVNAPAGAWGTIPEPDLITWFHDTHKGKLDSFLIDNSTGLYLRGGASQPRVKFTVDECPLEEERPGWFTSKMVLRTVL